MPALAVIIVLVILVIGAVGIYYYAKKPKTPPSEVYVADLGRYQIGASAAPAFAGLFGAQVATLDQLRAAQKDGAEWCYYSYVNTAKPGDPPTYEAYYPMQTAKAGCGSAIGVNNEGATPGHPYGVALYGPKPPAGTYSAECVPGQDNACVLGWNSASYHAPGAGGS